MVGNWDVVRTDLDGDEVFDPTEIEPRNHNDVNELNDRDPDGSGGNDPLNLTYDKAGNLRTEEIGSGSTTVTYTHDAWNRLVEVKYANDVRGEYEYNGLNWRIIKRADTDANKILDQQRIMYYSASWQLLEERIDDDSPFTPDPLATDVDRHMQYVWGVRYIDDIILHRENDDFTNDSPVITYEAIYYHLTDVQFSTVAVINASADLVERVSYSPYGEARHHRRADLDGDGDTDSADQTILLGAWAAGTMAGDLDRSGVTDSADLTILLGDSGGALPAGQLSFSNVDSQIGWDGYVYNAETKQYTVRYRCYDPVLGRWLERDPVEYRDGMDLYQYAMSNPATAADPWGLAPAGCGGDAHSQGIPGGCASHTGSTGGPSNLASEPPWWVTGCASEARNWNNCMFCCYYHSDGRYTPQGRRCADECDREFPHIPNKPSRPDSGKSYLQCLDTKQKQSDLSSCDKKYGRCDCLYGANVRFMCKCMGNGKWEDFVRACLQCMLRVPGMSWHRAHKLCWEKANNTFPLPLGKLLKCTKLARAWQCAQCGGQCKPPAGR